MKSWKSRVSAYALSALALLAASGCDKASPVAPKGSFLTISASPTKVGLTGSSTVTVEGRKPTGGPLNDGTEIRFTVDKGTVTPAIAEIRDGQATATFRADGRSGTSKVSATTGDGSTTATIDIQVGESTDTKPVLIVSASPNNVPVGATSTITIIARNADGSPVAAGQQVILTSTLGSLNPSRPTTRSDGTATSTLSAGNQAGTATITAILGASDPKTTDVTIRDAATAISVQANPATVPPGGGSTTLTAFVANAQGLPVQGAPVTFESQRGTLQTTGVVFTNTSGVATNTLTLTQQQLTGVTSFTVTASTPSGTGALLD
ncbi:MAG: invasin domain 3-containing protein, partial [Acidimicrobiales bacterium]